MGPDIDQNLKDFDFGAKGPLTEGTVAALGTSMKQQLGDFKLIGSMWSPAPWLKVSSGNRIQNQSGVLPKNGTPWPFIWGGNFAGGHLDTSGTPRAEFDDSALGGTGPTSALTQYARSLAAWLRGFQDTYGVHFYAVSLQNELGFEEFYNSCSYPQAAAYLKVLKAARAELDAYPDLAGIRIMGPEDLLGGGAYGMWQYGGGATATDKNLKILQAIAGDPDAAKDLSYFCIHGYAPDGVASAGAAPTQWQWWRDGWTTSPAAGLPATLKGFSAYGKKSWMTETSGEQTAWLSPSTGFPGKGAFGVALEIEQALTTGDESAWVYWQLTDGKPVAGQTLTDATALSTSPKYVAAKHFFRFIRPGSVRVATKVDGSTTLSASAYLDDATSTLVVELVNASNTDQQVDVTVPADPAGALGLFGDHLQRRVPVAAGLGHRQRGHGVGDRARLRDRDAGGPGAADLRRHRRRGDRRRRQLGRRRRRGDRGRRAHRRDWRRRRRGRRGRRGHRGRRRARVRVCGDRRRSGSGRRPPPGAARRRGLAPVAVPGTRTGRRRPGSRPAAGAPLGSVPLRAVDLAGCCLSESS